MRFDGSSIIVRFDVLLILQRWLLSLFFNVSMLKMLKNRGRGRDNFQKDFLLRNLVHFKCWAIIGEISGNIVVGSYSV